MKRLALCAALLALAACATPGDVTSQGSDFRTYSDTLRGAAISCGLTQAELPVATAIGDYDWNPQQARFALPNGEQNLPAIADAESCMWEGTKHLIID
jgi:hypothetical protein